MKTPKAGTRQPLLFYRRTMDRVWTYTFTLGLFLGGVGYFALIRPTSILGFHSDIWLVLAAALAFLISAFAFFARFLASVQPRDTYLAVTTPFLRLRISYHRILSARPALVQQAFPPQKAAWAQRVYLEPFYGKTVLVLELTGFPINPLLLRLFLPREMFAPQTTGLLLLVPDWMKLSTELDSFRSLRQQARNRPNTVFSR